MANLESQSVRKDNFLNRMCKKQKITNIISINKIQYTFEMAWGTKISWNRFNTERRNRLSSGNSIMTPGIEWGLIHRQRRIYAAFRSLK